MSLILMCQKKNPDMGAVKELLAKGREESGLDEFDDQGMTPLQHAAFKGNADLVKLLIENGAEVNTYEHNEGYSTLMFGALSGNTKTVQILLDAGAKTHTLNKVNRTASEMAAFLGLKHIVATIKGYVPVSDVEYYTKKHGLETEPKLPQELVEPLRAVVMQANVHPVRIIFFLEKHPELLDKKVCSVLELMSERYFKEDGNEWLSGKVHFVKCIIEYVLKNEVETSLKLLLKGRSQDGFKLNLDNFIRSCVRSYGFHQSGEFRQMVATLANTSQEPPVEDDGAIMVFLGRKPEDGCQACWEVDAKNNCAACKAVVYCDRRCQKIDWSSHKKMCALLKMSSDEGAGDASEM